MAASKTSAVTLQRADVQGSAPAPIRASLGAWVAMALIAAGCGRSDDKGAGGAGIASGASAANAASDEAKAGGAQGAEGAEDAEGAGAVVPTPAEEPSAEAAGVGESEAGAGVAWELANASAAKELDLQALPDAIAASVGKVGRCRLLLAPSPVALSAREQTEVKAQMPVAVASRRTVLFCKTAEEGLKSTPVVTYFVDGEEGAILDLDRDSVVAVQFAGTLTGQPTALYRGFIEGARRPAPQEGRPDLLTALIWPDKVRDQKVRCTSTTLATPSPSGESDADARALVGGALAARRALLRCADARGGSVGISAYVGPKNVGELLKVGKDTELELTLRGFADNQLVARLERVISGALDGGGEGDALRRFLLDPTPMIGQTVACTVLLAPSPQVGGNAVVGARGVIRGELAPVYATVACAAAHGSVPVQLHFAADAGARVLEIGNDTVVELSLWSADAGRIVARFEGVTKGGIAPPKGLDWRALAIDPARGAGKTLSCDVLVRPFIGPRAAVAAEKVALAGDAALGPRVAVLGCRDHANAAGGTRVEVFFDAKDDGTADGIEAGKQVTLRILGAVAGVVVAKWP